MASATLRPGPDPRYSPRSLWWRHEALHRRILQDYPARVEVLREEQAALEEELRGLASAAPRRRRFAVTEQAFARAAQAEARWLAAIGALPVEHRPGLVYQSYWNAQNRSAGVPLLPS